MPTRDGALGAGYGQPAGGGPGETRDAEPRSRPEHHLGGALGGRATADLVQVGRPKMGQRMSQRFEVVQDQKLLDTKGGSELLQFERPGGVGEFNPFPENRRSDGKGCRRRPLRDYRPGRPPRLSAATETPHSEKLAGLDSCRVPRSAMAKRALVPPIQWLPDFAAQGSRGR
jgi:hypothetical protein